MAVKTVQTVINGQTYNLTRNSSTGKYEATITAPNKSSYNQPNHYYDVTVKATVHLQKMSHLLKVIIQLRLLRQIVLRNRQQLQEL